MPKAVPCPEPPALRRMLGLHCDRHSLGGSSVLFCVMWDARGGGRSPSVGGPRQGSDGTLGGDTPLVLAGAELSFACDAGRATAVPLEEASRSPAWRAPPFTSHHGYTTTLEPRRRGWEATHVTSADLPLRFIIIGSRGRRSGFG